MDVFSAMHDFEWAIIKAVEKAFRPKIHKGCNFHWLQAIRAKMVKKYNLEVKFVDENIHHFKFMTIIEQDRDVMLKAMEYVREKCLAWKGPGKRERKVKINAFFDEYFVKQWLCDTEDGRKMRRRKCEFLRFLYHCYICNNAN